MTAGNDNKVTQVIGEDLGACPWCGGRVAASLATDTEPGSIMHSLPTCARFDESDALAFATDMRRELERRAKS